MKNNLAIVYLLASVFLMFVGVLICINSAISMNNSALSQETSITLYRFIEANYYIGLAMFLTGFLMVITPIVIDWYQKHYSI